jgi:hypothetical protein
MYVHMYVLEYHMVPYLVEYYSGRTPDTGTYDKPTPVYLVLEYHTIMVTVHVSYHGRYPGRAAEAYYVDQPNFVPFRSPLPGHRGS